MARTVVLVALLGSDLDRGAFGAQGAEGALRALGAFGARGLGAMAMAGAHPPPGRATRRRVGPGGGRAPAVGVTQRRVRKASAKPQEPYEP